MGGPVRLLYVDDSSTDREAFAQRLRQRGLPWQVTAADALDAARHALAAATFDAAVVDAHLPDGHGADLLRLLHGVPAVLLAEGAEALDLRLAFPGADDWLSRDPQGRYLDALVLAVARALERRRAQHAAHRLRADLRRTRAQRASDRRQGSRADQVLRRARADAEAALRQSEERLRLAQQAGRVGIFDRDMRAGRSVWNDVLYDIYGLDPAQAGNPGEARVRMIHPDDRPGVDQVMDRTLAARATDLVEEHRIVRPDGQVRWVAVRGLITYDEAGEPVRMLGASLDVTERRRAEEELRRSHDELERRVAERTGELQQRAEQLARLASQLTLAEQRERRRLAHLLHDHLQQLLVGASFGLEVLARRVGPGQQDALRRVHALLNESIQVSRSLTVELSPPILHEAGLAAGLEWLARWMREKHGLEVGVQADPHGDPEREDVSVLLFQAARELLFNVAKHAGVSQARVSLRPLPDDQVELTVSDVGRGFEPGRVPSEDRERSSTGFGLFSIRERLSLLGGRLEVDSAPDRGTALRLVAPTGGSAPSSRPEEPLASAAAPPVPPPARQASPPGGPVRILLADDHVVMRQGLSSLLAMEGDLQVVGEASTGREAVEQARRLQPDVILMDFSMPEMDGVEATRRIHAELPHIRIVGLSMYGETDRAAAMREAGAEAYFTKSGRTDALLAAIRHTS